MAANNFPTYKPYSSVAEQPLASLVPSLHVFSEDDQLQPYQSSMIAQTAHFTTVITLLALTLAFLYVIMNDRRRHAVMYASTPITCAFLLLRLYFDL